MDNSVFESIQNNYEAYINYHRKLFVSKNEFLIERYGLPWDPASVYDFIFGDFIQDQGVVLKDKYNGILVYSKKNKAGEDVFKREMFFKGSDLLLKRSRMPFLITNGVLYAGKKNKAENARLMCALIIDLDGVDDLDRLELLLHRFELSIKEPGVANHITKPTFLINSGTGFHVYYVFEKPIPMFPNIRRQLMEFKRQLTRHLWVDGITKKTGEHEVQYQPITQGFRTVGSNTKLGEDFKVTAFKLGDRYPIDYWDSWIEGQATAYRNNDLEPISINYKSRLSIEEAKVKYPEWYEKRIVRGVKKGFYLVKRDLYDWYKRELLSKQASIEGKRYYRIMCLAIFAKKCGISREELERDALDFGRNLNSDNHKHMFTKKDVYDALEMYNDNYYTFPRKSIVNLTGYQMKENKRNFRKQKDHLHIARFILEQDVKSKGFEKRGRISNFDKINFYFKYANEEFTTMKDIEKKLNIKKQTIIKHMKNSNPEIAALVKRGRVTKEKEVKELLKKYPGKNISQLSKISGINRNTISKYFHYNEKF